MDNKFSVAKVLPVLFGFFVMGFCDIVGISSDYAASAFGWSATMAGLIPSVVFVYGLALKRRPEKANEISGLMIMAVAGGTVSFLVGAANDWSGITGGALVIALEIVYLTYCAYFVKP